MKKNLKKILILLILFVLAAAGYFTWSWMQLREDGAVYTSIEDANLPVAYVNILGRRMNELDGFVEDSQKAAGRGDLTLLPADRKLSVTIDKLDSQITGSDARPLSSSHARSRAASVCRGCCGAASGAGTLCPTEAVRNRRDCLPRLRISREGRQAARPQLAGTPDPFPYGAPCGGAS